ncbi:MAG: site-2 protease family protein, partial [Terracidiphilus sp.]
ACLWLWGQTHDPLWAALARAGAFLNLLNLIPVWILDGAKAVSALGQPERVALLAAILGVWYFSGQNLFILLAAGAVYCLFSRDKAPVSDWKTWLYFVGLMAALAWILAAAPAAATGRSPF